MRRHHSKDLEQPFGQDSCRGRVLPGEQVAVNHRIGLPHLALGELDSQVNELVLQQPAGLRAEPDRVLLLVRERRDPVAA